MGYLKIIFYGLLAFVERNPIFTLFLIGLAIFAPVVFKVAGWIILAVILTLVIFVAIGALRMRRMRREMEEQMRNNGAGFSGFNTGGFSAGGFSGFNTQGMTLEELVRRMQAEADAQRRAQSGSTTAHTTTTTTTGKEKRVSDKVGDYVDFEEVE